SRCPHPAGPAKSRSDQRGYVKMVVALLTLASAGIFAAHIFDALRGLADSILCGLSGKPLRKYPSRPDRNAKGNSVQDNPAGLRRDFGATELDDPLHAIRQPERGKRQLHGVLKDR